MAQSPEISGGGGFTFEDAPAAIYLGALLGEESAPGLEHRVITRVALQQAAFGEPLDDLIVDARAPDDSLARLSLQVKRELTISAAVSNTDFREIVTRAWATLAKANFRENTDRVGVATGTVSEASRRALDAVCGWARASNSADVFLEHFQAGAAGEDRRGILETFRQILADQPSGKVEDAGVYRLLRHFVLIKLDVLHEGATDESHAIERLRSHLHDPDRAGDLWSRLLRIARDGAGRASEFSRAALLGELRGAFRLAGARSLRQELACIQEETKNALATIAHDVDGVEIARPVTVNKITAALESSRFVHIIGLPGTGKSAVLRACVEAEGNKGTVLLLKSDRLAGPNWAAQARALGLPATTIEPLLCEIAATGSSILFVDGIDRVEIQNQGILRDLLNAIVRSPLLIGWKVVATSRDNGIEPLRTWLPASFFGGGLATVVVEPFDDDEATALARERPMLRPLLFGDDRVREIARRPFFAAVLAQTFRHSTSTQAPPKSEVELIDVWWSRGGYDSDERHARHRQRALIQLAKAGAFDLGRRVRLDGVDLDAVHDLKRDNVIKDVSAGHTIQFAHDIFFEWAFLHLLIDRDKDWLEEIRRLGEPPVLGRVVELLSQSKFTQDDAWEETLAALEASPTRPQWTRAWLIAPFGAPTFWDHAASFTKAMMRDKARRLSKLAVWFQAEKTRANPMILDRGLSGGNLTRREIVRLADAFAWPSDFASWGRFCNWAILKLDQFPIGMIPDVVSAFEVWQNMFADLTNAVSKSIFDTVTMWLEDIEDRQYPEEFKYDPGPWGELERAGIKELEERLRALLLRGAHVDKDRVRSYLNRVNSRKRLRDHAFKQIVMFAPFLATNHADQLVALTLAEVKRPLPAEVAARPVQPGDFPHNFSYHDWRELAVDDDYQCFYPPSPLREPFASLFQNAPDKAQELVRDITNHAITAWRQLFTLDRERRGTPLPLKLHFPWGDQDFWGTAQTYVWARGHWAPHPVICGLMALENWAFAEVERRRTVDDVIADVLRGHDSCAVLSIAAALVLSTKRVSLVTLPLVTSQKIWEWDVGRYVSESRVNSNLIGFMKPSDKNHADAVDAANKRPARRMEIRWLAQLFVISADENLRTRAQAAITAFPEELSFGFEEEKNDEAHVASVRRKAQIWSEWGKLENYYAVNADDGSGTYIGMQNPTASDPDVVAIAQRTARMGEQLTLLHWATESIESGSLSTKLALSEAVQRAQAIDREDLFSERHGDVSDAGMDQSAVAGASAAILFCGGTIDAVTLGWAKGAVMRAHATPEKREAGWFAGSKHLYHPCLFAVDGVAGLIRRGVDTYEAERALLRLGGHPLEEVSEKAIGAALSLWETNTALAWAGLNLGIQLSIGSSNVRWSPYGYDHATQQDRVEGMVAQAIQQLDAPGGSSLPAVPAAWVFAPPAPRGELFDDSAWGREPIWRDADEFLRWDFLPKVLVKIPIPLVMADATRRSAFLAFSYDLLNWTNERLNPSWHGTDADRRKHRATELLEWRRQFCSFLAKLALVLDPDEVQQRILDPIFAHEDTVAASLINPFADILAAGGIIDPPTVSADALRHMQACVQRILRDRAWEQARHRDGTIPGFDLPEIVRIFLFATGVRAGGSARFANGDWRDIMIVQPIIDAFVRAVGDVPHVMSSFLTLCENAIENYSVPAFVEQVSTVLNKQDGTPIGWRGTIIPSRIAALIHAFAEKSQPLPLPLAQAMLRILDRLVDMGDRRSAALQISETFKDVRF